VLNVLMYGESIGLDCRKSACSVWRSLHWYLFKKIQLLQVMQ
jgi:hypothetical protein